MSDLALIAKRLRDAGRLMVGIPDYDAYVAHHRIHHPHEPEMSFEQFFRDRQEARYGGRNGGRCC